MAGGGLCGRTGSCTPERDVVGPENGAGAVSLYNGKSAEFDIGGCDDRCLDSD